MEESSNGRVEEEAPKIEANDDHEHQKQVVLEDSVDADGNAHSVNKNPDEESEAEAKIPPAEVENSEEKVEEEKVVSDAVVEQPAEPEPAVSLSKDIESSLVEKAAAAAAADSDVAELVDAKGLGEKSTPTLDEAGSPIPMLTDLLINGSKEEPEQLPVAAETSTESSAVLLTDVESKGMDDQETKLPAVAADVVSKAKGIEEATTSYCSAENGGIPAVADEEGSSGSPDLASKQNVGDSLVQAANVPIVETRDIGDELTSKPEIPENNTGNQPIISLNQRPTQPTSWKSCCGLFEVLRGSNR